MAEPDTKRSRTPKPTAASQASLEQRLAELTDAVMDGEIVAESSFDGEHVTRRVAERLARTILLHEQIADRTLKVRKITRKDVEALERARARRRGGASDGWA